MLALVAFAAAPAMAQSGAEDEYELTPNIPQANEQGGTGGGSGGSGGADTSGSQPGSSVPSVNAESSDDGGGVPVLLILLAVIAAACTGVAVWRLRQSSDPSERESAQGAKPGTSAASETHSV